jgi:hypothetical protein
MSTVLGYNTKGGSNTSLVDTNFAWHDITDENGGITDLLHVYCANSGGFTKSVKLAIYADAGDNQPGAQLAEEITVSVPNLTDGEVSGAYVVELAPSTKYWIACICEDGDVDIYYNSDDENRQAYSGEGQGYDLKDPFPYSGNYSNRFSVWATYAPAASADWTTHTHSTIVFS